MAAIPLSPATHSHDVLCALIDGVKANELVVTEEFVSLLDKLQALTMQHHARNTATYYDGEPVPSPSAASSTSASTVPLTFSASSTPELLSGPARGM